MKPLALHNFSVGYNKLVPQHISLYLDREAEHQNAQAIFSSHVFVLLREGLSLLKNVRGNVRILREIRQMIS